MSYAMDFHRRANQRPVPAGKEVTMNYDELASVIKKMSKEQRKAEVVVFEEGTRRYIWPARLTKGDRPYLEGVADEGDPDVEFFDPAKAKGEKVEPHEPHPTQLDSEVPMKPDRPRAARPTGLDRSVKKRKK